MDNVMTERLWRAIKSAPSHLTISAAKNNIPTYRATTKTCEQTCPRNQTGSGRISPW